MLGTAALALAVPSSGATAAPAAGPAPSVAPDEGAAAKAAKKHGKRVEALSERTEFSQTFAEPSGRLTYEAAAVPQRVHRPDGSWADIDVNLAKGEGGLLRPAATLADVRFSAGGSGPLVTMVRDGKKLTMSWPHGSLPAPSVSGDSATYPGVLPDVDLVVRATRTGFTHVLVVKTPKAAANPAVREVKFDLGGDAQTRRLPDGSLQAVAGGTLLALAQAPQMWDSAVPAATSAKERSAPAGQADTRSNAVKSTHAAPGDAARVAKLGTEIDRTGDLVLRPDPRLLGSAAKFPVFIDPEWSTAKSRWAYATNNNTNNTDTSVARVGEDPDSGKVYRSFFEFPTTKIKGKHIESAYVQMKVDHTWSCTKTPTSMYRSGVISTPRTAWSTSLGTYLTSASSNANEGSGCDDSPQPNMTVNFTGGVAGVLAGVAQKGSTTVTFGFSARDSDGTSEGDETRWKKFFPNDAKLIADVDAKPTVPTQLQVNGVACTTAGISVGVTNPYFSAMGWDGDASQALKATWQLYQVAASGALTAISAPAVTSAPANKRNTSARRTGLVTNTRYAFRLFTTDPSPYNIASPTTGYCYFTIDTTVPPVTITPLSLPEGPGELGRFKISSTATDVSKFKYGWTEAVTSEAPAVTVTGVTGKEAEVVVTAPKYGITVLYAQAIDATNNKGYGSHEFTVGRPSPAVAGWGLETYPVNSGSGPLDDRQPVLNGNTPLTESNVAWTSESRAIGGQAATFGGNSQATTTDSVLDTTESFSVAAWVRLSAMPGDLGVVTQDGTQTVGFGLGTRQVGSPLTPRWSFAMKDTDAQSALTQAAYSATAITSADIGRWTHIAGVYDKEAKQVRLYVNGVLSAEAARTATPWASGKLGVGRYLTGGLLGNWFKGQIVDVQAFDRVLVPHDFSGQMATDVGSGGVDEPGIVAPIQVGKWDFESAVPCYQAGEANMCEAPDAGTGWKRRLELTQGAFTGGGYGSAQGLTLDDAHFADDPTDPHYGEVTTEYGIVQRNIAPADSAPQWQAGPVLRTDQPFTVSAWVQPAKLTSTMTAVSQRGNYQSPFYLQTRQSTVDGITGMRFEVMTVSADATDTETYAHLIAPTLLTAEDTDEWFQLTFVYIPWSPTQLRLYVNGELAKTGSGTLWQTAGPMAVGRAFWSADPGTGRYTDQWFGTIDNVQIYQGYMTSGQVAQQFEEQAVS
ncbi:LamG domain-containing protein [Actinoplanes sp. NPDC049668]|uniref:LamG domain-containing protein n=1 Tax=unclassified Actinoplanes TaxID=2626549 RepID=UPI00339FB5D6